MLNDAALQGLAVILTLHGYYELEADVPGHEPRLLALWRQLSAHYRDPNNLPLFDSATGQWDEAIVGELIPRSP